MREITEELLDRMSHKVVVKLVTVRLGMLSRVPPEKVVTEPKPEDYEAVVKQVLRDELT